jgi:hypothetical protein
MLHSSDVNASSLSSEDSNADFAHKIEDSDDDGSQQQVRVFSDYNKPSKMPMRPKTMTVRIMHPIMNLYRIWLLIPKMVMTINDLNQVPQHNLPQRYRKNP